MDIIFNCTSCQQELAVDAAGAGSEIECPTCGTSVLVPAATPENTQSTSMPASSDEPARDPKLPPKVEKHFAVPQHTAGEVLIKKPKPTLEIAAKDTDRKIRVKTIRHSDCVEVGKDKFDETVTEFLQKIGQEHIISITPISYSYTDLATRAAMQDFAVMVVFKG